MKRQTVQHVDMGKHNANLKASIARVRQSGSWKKQRVIKILPAGVMMSSRVALSHECLMPPPNNAYARLLAVGEEVGEAYSNTIDGILKDPELSKWEYILTIEHDNCPPPDGLLRLIEQMEAHPEFAAIGGLYWTKGDGGVAQIWGDPTDTMLNFRPQLPDPMGGLVECCGLGMGFTLFRLKMFKDQELRRPWFKTEKKEGVWTQDLYFWTNARRYGYRCAVDCSVKVGHYDAENDVMW